MGIHLQPPAPLCVLLRFLCPGGDILQTYVQHGLADRTETGYRLTPKGFLVSNAIISSLCDALAEEKRRRAEKTARGDYRVV